MTILASSTVVVVFVMGELVVDVSGLLGVTLAVPFPFPLPLPLSVTVVAIIAGIFVDNGLGAKGFSALKTTPNACNVVEKMLSVSTGH